jgi:hypothetical protein
MLSNASLLMMLEGFFKIPKETSISLTVGQGTGYAFVTGGHAYPLTFYGYSSGELPISLLNSEIDRGSITIGTDAVNTFGSAPELEKLGIKAVFSTNCYLRSELDTWIYISKDSPIWKTNYEGLDLFRTDIVLQDGETDAITEGYFGGESVKGQDALYFITPYALFLDSGETLSERPFIEALDVGKTVPMTLKLLTASELEI